MIDKDRWIDAFPLCRLVVLLMLMIVQAFAHGMRHCRKFVVRKVIQLTHGEMMNSVVCELFADEI